MRTPSQDGRNAEGTACIHTVPKTWPDQDCLHPYDAFTIDAMLLQIHTQPAPDQLCDTCGGPSEWMSQSVNLGNGNQEMAREMSPWRPRCADPSCQSRRPRHRR